jgi:hypothetical protein
LIGRILDDLLIFLVSSASGSAWPSMMVISLSGLDELMMLDDEFCLDGGPNFENDSLEKIRSIHKSHQGYTVHKRQPNIMPRGHGTCIQKMWM